MCMRARIPCRSLLQNKTNLTSAILDALSNLNVANSTAEEVDSLCTLNIPFFFILAICIFMPWKVLEVALDKASSADISDLPTIIKFIVQYISPRNAQDVCVGSLAAGVM